MSSSTLENKDKDKIKIRVRLKSYDHRIIDNCCKQIIDIVVRNGAQVIGPILLPTEIKRYSVNRASFVKKTSQEQFEIRVHKRIIDILNPNQKIIESLTNLNLPAGVEIEIKT
ncbi:MAG TPA: 30S ribosomal protein S10 [Candidatus Paceibacterota bacterium]|jgi:small subunit ribosomal protein S10|nr:30S ribosomal protein S10 [Candidatus Paceibacterota bacterium]HRV32015.1 30S ribosomal protein S10 [Candidatus Paceibacterota bacterium]